MRLLLRYRVTAKHLFDTVHTIRPKSRADHPAPKGAPISSAVLLTDDSQLATPDCLTESLQTLRGSSDDARFELLVVPSVEDTPSPLSR